MIPFIDLQAQRARIKPQIDEAIARVIEHGRYIMGPEIAELESELASFCGAGHVIGCANGTDALQLALMCLEIGPGDAVFVPSFTFVATVEAVALASATPVFVDVEQDTFNLSPSSFAEALDSVIRDGDLTPKAVIPVDLFGQPADYPKIREIAHGAKLTVIADAAQSFGASFGNRKVGTLGDISTTSFFPAKPLGCYGDGGALFTDNEEWASLLRSYRNHGQGVDRYDNVRIGLNSRLDSIHAAILLEKLKIFAEEISLRDAVASRYMSALPSGFTAQVLRDEASSVWAQYTLLHEERDRVCAQLKKSDIPTAIYYPRPNHLQAPYREAPLAPNGLPVTEYLQDRVFSLPMHPYLDNDTQMNIISALAE